MKSTKLLAGLILVFFAIPAAAQQKKGGVSATIGKDATAAITVTLSWVPSNGCVAGTGAVNCTPVTSFIIRRGTVSGGETNYATVALASLITCPTGVPPNNTQCWQDAGTLSPGSTYYYQIEAVNQGGSSGPSNEANAPIPPTLVVPNPPSGVTTQQP